eukprot:g25118.t1
MKFNVGDKVYYQSKSFGQRIIATVEGITSEGFYDLDVRQSADPKNISPYIAAWLHLECWATSDMVGICWFEKR